MPHPIELIQLSLQSVKPIIPVMLEAMDSGNGTGEFGALGAVNFVASKPVDWMFEILVELLPANGHLPTLPALPELMGGREGFELMFPVEYQNAAGKPIAEAGHTFLYDITQGQVAHFENVEVLPFAPNGRGVPSAFGIRGNVVIDGDFDPARPLFETTMMADYVAFETTAVELAAAPTPTLLLWAQPSVTARGTELVFNDAIGATGGAGAEVRIFDVAGRLARVLAAPPGATRVAWDGRDAAGAPLPTGVYLARLTGTAHTARIVLVR